MHVKTNAHLANIPGLDVLQFNQELLITACLEFFYKYPTVSRLYGEENLEEKQFRK